MVNGRWIGAVPIEDTFCVQTFIEKAVATTSAHADRLTIGFPPTFINTVQSL
jgi:hypothetical protein